MTISIKRYVNIVSGVGGAASVSTRSFMGRIVSKSTLLPPRTVAEFTTLDDVSTYFGQTSNEYKVAAKYFGFTSKSITKPQVVGFCRWNNAAVPPTVYGGASAALADFVAITAGTLDVVVNGVVVPIGPLDFSTALSMTDVAGFVTFALNANANPMLATASTPYNSNSKQFIFFGGVPGAGTVTFNDTPLAQALGWFNAGQIETEGAALQTALEAISDSTDASDNFGAFSYTDFSLTEAEVVTIAEWNHAQNNKFIFCTPIPIGSAATAFAALKGFSGTAVTVTDTRNGEPRDWAENCPMEILAATDYSRAGSSQNYMYYQFPSRPATVLTNTNADLMDESRINYIGQTQTAGNPIEFYQRGVLMGGSADATDMTTYAGEMWLKDRFTVDLLNLFLALPSLPANNSGRASILGIMQGGINGALFNGIISVGKPLTELQKVFIVQITGIATSWQQVQSSGYFLDVQLENYVDSSGATQWRAVYVLIYSKNDQIRSVRGSNILI